MADFASIAATEGLGLPLAVGGVLLSALPEIERWSVAPYRGRERAVAEALGGALSVGRATPLGAGRILFAGLGTWLVEGASVGEHLAGLAAVTEQGDAWAALALTGGAARAVLARLVPLDLDAAAFREGSAARSLLRHGPLLIVATGAGFDLLVPRSYAASAVGDLTEAMRRAAARATLWRGDGKPG